MPGKDFDERRAQFYRDIEKLTKEVDPEDDTVRDETNSIMEEPSISLPNTKTKKEQNLEKITIRSGRPLYADRQNQH